MCVFLIVVAVVGVCLREKGVPCNERQQEAGSVTVGAGTMRSMTSCTATITSTAWTRNPYVKQ